ncbi:MAG: class I SAM-dependent methyltransferase [Calditrichaceae bacterium]|nr:class I SAM-dependent methyltransferase [Calditrichaceae bacterium]
MNITEEFFDKYYLKSFNPETHANPTPQEVEFIIGKTNLKKDAKILDFTCGQGRHTIEFYKRGYLDIIGIDHNPSHVEMAKTDAGDLTNAPNFIHKEMQDFEEYNCYDLVYSLFTSMFYFSDQHNLDILQRIYNGLKRDGHFVIDYFNPIAFLKTQKKKDWYFSEDDSIVLERYSHNPISGMITNERIIVPKEGPRIKRVYHVRDYTVAELRYHFENIGFEVLDVYGNFEGEKYNIDSLRQIYIMRKPE